MDLSRSDDNERDFLNDEIYQVVDNVAKLLLKNFENNDKITRNFFEHSKRQDGSLLEDEIQIFCAEIFHDVENVDKQLLKHFENVNKGTGSFLQHTKEIEDSLLECKDLDDADNRVIQSSRSDDNERVFFNNEIYQVVDNVAKLLLKNFENNDKITRNFFEHSKRQDGSLLEDEIQIFCAEIFQDVDNVDNQLLKHFENVKKGTGSFLQHTKETDDSLLECNDLNDADNRVIQSNNTKGQDVFNAETDYRQGPLPSEPYSNVKIYKSKRTHQNTTLPKTYSNELRLTMESCFSFKYRQCTMDPSRSDDNDRDILNDEIYQVVDNVAKLLLKNFENNDKITRNFFEHSKRQDDSLLEDEIQIFCAEIFHDVENVDKQLLKHFKNVDKGTGSFLQHTKETDDSLLECNDLDDANNRCVIQSNNTKGQNVFNAETDYRQGPLPSEPYSNVKIYKNKRTHQNTTLPKTYSKELRYGYHFKRNNNVTLKSQDPHICTLEDGNMLGMQYKLYKPGTSSKNITLNNKKLDKGMHLRECYVNLGQKLGMQYKLYKPGTPSKNITLNNKKIDKGMHLRECYVNLGQKSYVKICRMVRNVVQHTQEKFICDICQKSYVKKYVLVRHMAQNNHRVIHSKLNCYSCDMCGKLCYSVRCLKAHMYTMHSAEGEYECSDCGKIYSMKRKLQRHIVYVHQRYKPCKCYICKKGFASKFSLLRHLNWHSGHKPYKCDVCERVFTQKTNLNTHMVTHAGIKKFLCPICEESFGLKWCVIRHMKTHENGI